MPLLVFGMVIVALLWVNKDAVSQDVEDLFMVDAQTFLNRIQPYENLISAMADTYQISELWIKAVIYTESSGNEKADSGDSVGLMQINLNTAKRLGYAGTREELFIPYNNLLWGCKVLKDALIRYQAQGPDYVYAYYNDGRAVKNSAGQFVNSRGDTIVQDHVNNFLRKYQALT